MLSVRSCMCTRKRLKGLKIFANNSTAVALNTRNIFHLVVRDTKLGIEKRYYGVLNVENIANFCSNICPIE